MYRFRAAENFWKKFYRLSPEQKESVRRAWGILKIDPFDSRLGTHKINSLSSQYRKTVYSVVIETDLRVIFISMATLSGRWMSERTPFTTSSPTGTLVASPPTVPPRLFQTQPGD
jgi:hypothetical protein